MSRHGRLAPTAGLLLLGLYLLIFSSCQRVFCTTPIQPQRLLEDLQEQSNSRNEASPSMAGVRLNVEQTSNEPRGVATDAWSQNPVSGQECEVSRRPKLLGPDVYLTYSAQRGDDAAQNWRHRYLEEQAEAFETKVLEESLDERLANTIHTIVGTRLLGLDFSRFNSGDARKDAINMELVAGPQVDDSRCRQHLEQMLDLQNELAAKLTAKRANSSLALDFDERHLRLARVLDSYGRYESGHLSGKMHSLGQYDQCTSTHLILKVDDDERKVETGYCWAHIDLNKHLNEGLRRRARNEFELSNNALRVGVCLPRSCHTKTFAKNRDLIQRLVDSQFQFPPGLYIDETLRVDSIFCLVDSESPQASLPFSAKLLLVLCASWFASATYATFFAHNYKQQQMSPAQAHSGRQPGASSALLDCLNLRKSWQDWLGGQSGGPTTQVEQQCQLPKREVDLDAMNVVKALGCAIVVFVHSGMVQGVTSQDFPRFAQQLQTNPMLVSIFTFGFDGISLFSVITGLLSGYSFMRGSNRRHGRGIRDLGGAPSKLQASGELSGRHTGQAAPDISKHGFFTLWLRLALTRYLRLVPLYFLVFWFKKSVLINCFAGRPLWDAGFNKDSASGACRLESWTTPFTMMAAFTPLARQCLGQAWSVANDLFHSLTITPIMLIIPRRPKLALLVSVIIVALGDAIALDILLKIDPHQAAGILKLKTYGIAALNESLSHLYTYPHLRFGAVLIGLMAGYCLSIYGEKISDSDEERRPKEWPHWFSGPATTASVAFVLLKTYSVLIPRLLRLFTGDSSYDQLPLPLVLLLKDATIWSLCSAVLLMRLCTDWSQNFIVRLFSGSLGRALARLNYAILLIHLEVLYYFALSGTNLNYFRAQGIVETFGHCYLYCIPLAIFVHVVYENPIDKLVKRFVIPKLFV